MEDRNPLSDMVENITEEWVCSILNEFENPPDDVDEYIDKLWGLPADFSRLDLLEMYYGDWLMGLDNHPEADQITEDLFSLPN